MIKTLKTHVQNIFWLVERNLVLDYKILFHNKKLNLSEKLQVIAVKYKSLIKHWFVMHTPEKDYEYLLGRKLYYNTKYGTVGYQVGMAEHMVWLSNINLGNNPTIIDIGANVGNFALPCFKTLNNPQIFCVEPSETAFNTLLKNTSGISDIKCFNTAISDKKENSTLYVDSKETAKSSMLNKQDGYLVQDINTVTLDEFVAENIPSKNIDLLKIDVEGMELAVLKGATETVKKTRYIDMEINQNVYKLSEIFSTIINSGKKFNLVYIRNFSNNQKDKFTNYDILLELY